MFQWVTHNGRGEREVFDLHALVLPDGQRAQDLPPGVLFRRLRGLGVKGIDPTLGAQQLLIQFARHLAATKRDPYTGKPPLPEGDDAA